MILFLNDFYESQNQPNNGRNKENQEWESNDPKICKIRNVHFLTYFSIVIEVHFNSSFFHYYIISKPFFNPVFSSFHPAKNVV